MQDNKHFCYQREMALLLMQIWGTFFHLQNENVTMGISGVVAFNELKSYYTCSIFSLIGSFEASKMIE